MRSNSTSTPRRTYRRFKTKNEHDRDLVHWSFRRRVCISVLLLNIILFVGLLSSTFYLYVQADTNIDFMVNFAMERRAIRKLNPEASISTKCDFIRQPFPDNAPLILKSWIGNCWAFRRPHAVMYNAYQLDRVQSWKHGDFIGIPPFCTDLVETSPCHESITNEGFKVEFRKQMPECIGLGDVYENMEYPSSDVPIFAPAIENHILEQYVNKDYKFLANELVVQCPVCVQESRPFTYKDDSNYYVALRTENRGWPTDFEFCKAIIPFRAKGNITDSETLQFSKIRGHPSNYTAELITTQSTEDPGWRR